MSLPEIIPSNLPQFVRLTPRSAFANSVVPQGCALYFAEPDGSGGAKFLYKNQDGSFTEVGGGGGGGSSMNFYRCSAVDTTNRKWSGYKLIIVDGHYDYEAQATTGLSYTWITPEVGTVYSADAMIIVRSVILPPSGPASPVNMSGYTDVDGWTVSADSEYPGELVAWKAFKNTQSGITWLSGNNQPYPHWLMWKNEQPSILVKYRFKSKTTQGYNKQLRSWELHASNDDFETYVVLDKQEDITWDSGELKSFIVSQTGMFQAYRLWCIAGDGGDYYAAVSELETNWE